MKPKFSIIIPIYNAEKYIKETLISIFNQTYKNFEVICVDDGSKDNSLKLLKQKANTEKRLKIISQQNSGAGVARNNGISKAKGDYILFIDADDLFSSNDTLQVINKLTEEENCDLYIFGFNRFNDGSEELNEYKIANFDNFAKISSIKIDGAKISYICENYKNNVSMFIHNWIAPWNKCYKKSFLNRINAKFDTIRSVEDRTFHFQTVTKSMRTMMVNYPIVNYRLNVAGSLTNNFNVKKLMNHISAYHSIIENTNMHSEKEINSFFISTVSDVYTFYNKSIESEKEQVFLKMQEFFREIKPKFENSKNDYNQYSIFFDITTGLTFPYADKNKRLIPIVFATNENYAPYLGVAVKSLMENCDKNVNYQVYVFYTKLNVQTIAKLESLSSNNVHVQCLNVQSYVEEQASSLYQQDYYSVEMYYRMLIAKILPMFDKVVYLDCDIIVLDDVKKLYDITNFENNELIAAGLDLNLDSNAEKYVETLGIKNVKNYINSGILVLNTRLIREENTFGNINSFLNNHKRLLFPDQDAINVLCDGRIYIFDKYWNFQWAAIFGKYYQGLINEKFGVVHYTTNVKPWKNPTMPLSEYFWKYAKQTPFYEQIIYHLGG